MHRINPLSKTYIEQYSSNNKIFDEYKSLLEKPLKLAITNDIIDLKTKLDHLNTHKGEYYWAIILKDYLKEKYEHALYFTNNYGVPNDLEIFYRMFDISNSNFVPFDKMSPVKLYTKQFYSKIEWFLLYKGEFYIIININTQSTGYGNVCVVNDEVSNFNNLSSAFKVIFA